MFNPPHTTCVIRIKSFTGNYGSLFCLHPNNNVSENFITKNERKLFRKLLGDIRLLNCIADGTVKFEKCPASHQVILVYETNNNNSIPPRLRLR